MTEAPILLVEDTSSLQAFYSAILRNAGFSVVQASNVRQAMDACKKSKPEIVLLDLMLPDGDGIDVMQQCLSQNPDIKVIVITSNGSVSTAVGAMRAGAFDFLVKPIGDQALMDTVMNARAELRRVTNAVSNQRVAASAIPAVAKAPVQPRRKLYGSSEAMSKIGDQIRSVGNSTASVFLSGESGTGKDVCAELIHAQSDRAHGPMTRFSCGAIRPENFESELFGHHRGAVPGAVSQRTGTAEAANGGTLFLDDICELDISSQYKLLNFVQTMQIQPVGGSEARRVDVRLICSTKRDPMAEIRAGRMREDLYYRLHVVPIQMPPLRDRGDDVIEIAEQILEDLATREASKFVSLSDRTKDLLRRYSWPGNVRQLENILWNIVIQHDGTQVTPEMLPGEMTSPLRAQLAGQFTDGGLGNLSNMTLSEAERLLIEDAISRSDGSIPKAARRLDVSPSTIYRKLEAWGPRGEATPDKVEK